MKQSKCNKCGNEGVHVGRNFRHCKTAKEWKELENKYKEEKIDMVRDFHYYPREGKEKLSEKYDNICNVVK